MNELMEQLKYMEEERKKLVARMNSTTGFEHDDAVAALKAHDVEVGRLLGYNQG